MTEFEQRTSGVASDRSTNWVTTTAQSCVLLTTYFSHRHQNKLVWKETVMGNGESESHNSSWWWWLQVHNKLQHNVPPIMAVVGAHLVERSLLIPEVGGLHPVIGKKIIFILNTCLLSTVYWKDENKEKEAWFGPFFKKVPPMRHQMVTLAWVDHSTCR